MEAQLQTTLYDFTIQAICKYNIRSENRAFKKKKMNQITISLVAFAYAFFLVMHSEQRSNITNEFSAIEQQSIFMSQSKATVQPEKSDSRTTD